MKSKRGKDNEPRKVGMYLVKELCDLKQQERAERFGTVSRSVGLGISRSRLKDAVRRKVSQTCQQHPPNLPTKDLNPV